MNSTIYSENATEDLWSAITAIKNGRTTLEALQGELNEQSYAQIELVLKTSKQTVKDMMQKSTVWPA